MPIGLYPSIESSQFGSTGDLDASINAAHHSTGFPINIPPSRKQLNRELFRIDGALNYLLQGIPEFTAGQSYGLGRLITDGTRIYKSLANTASAALGDLSDGTKWEIFVEKAATKSYDAAKPYAANDTIVDPTTGDIYKCIAAAPAGTPLSDATKFQKITQGNQGYDASTDTPALATIPNGTELFVESAGTQTIGGVVFDLNKGDIIKKSNAGTLSVLRGQTTYLHIEKAANYTLLEADLPEDEIVGLHNTSATSIDFTLPAGYLADIQPDYVDGTKTIITVASGQTIYIRNKQGNVIELLGSDLANAVSADYASSLDAIAGVITNKSVTPKGLADTLDNAATKGTNTKYGTLKTADTASAQAGTATDEALTSSNIPDIAASDVEAQAETITNKFLTPANLAAMQATDVEAQAMTELKKFLTPKNLDALRAVLADISDTAPLNDKFVTDEHLVDWFTSAGRTDTTGSFGSGLVFKLPGGYKVYLVTTVNNAQAANTYVNTTYNFPAGLWTQKPKLKMYSSGVTGSQLPVNCTTVGNTITQYSFGLGSTFALPAGAVGIWSLWYGK